MTTSTLSIPHTQREADNSSAAQSRTASFFNWLFGSRPTEPQLDSFNANPGPEFTVEPPADAHSWVDSFNTALTEATASFILRYVDPLHREDPTIGFSVKKVKVGLRDAAAQCVRAIESMPIAMRNRIVQLRMKKAHGSEQLAFDNFYGISITAEETLLDGQLIQTLVSYSGSRFVLKFEFEGEYVVLPDQHDIANDPAPSTDSATTLGEPIQASKNEQSPTLPEYQDPDTDKPASLTVKRLVSQETALRIPTRPEPQAGISPSRETPLNIPITPARPIAARLHLRSLGSETFVDLYEDNFPYSIGRHPSFSGYGVQGKLDTTREPTKLLNDAEPSGYTSYVSRNHIVLDQFDPVARQFNISSAKGKNGTFMNGSAMPKLFILPCSSDEWMSLGGEHGEGTLEIRFEDA